MMLSTFAQELKDAGLLLDTRGPLTGELGPHTTDTRKLEAKGILIAYKGVQFDAHSQVPALQKQFPSALFLIEDPACFAALPADARVWLVKDSREAWGYIAALKAGHPERKLKMIGVTGTNGKTSTVWFVRQILKAAGKPCLTLGTLGIYMGDEFVPSQHTTPDPDVLFQDLAQAVSKGIAYAAMEVSSHAIVQRRIGPIRFDAVAFTSFSRDHLDFHATMDEYFAAKWQLITRYRKGGAPAWISRTVEAAPLDAKAKIEVYGEGEGSYAYELVSTRLDHSEIRLKTPRGEQTLRLNFGGDFVMDNLTAAYALLDSLEALPQLDADSIRPVPGRFEPVVFDYPAGQNFAVVVDYAHTPDALEKTLAKLRTMTTGRLWAVFGCGGDRDKGKRPLMGEIAESIGDIIVVTSDNPRTERPDSILVDIIRGMPREKEVHMISDRREAIFYAVKHARPGDTVLIAGKGHEDYQILGTVKHPFDDRLVALEALQIRFPTSVQL